MVNSTLNCPLKIGNTAIFPSKMDVSLMDVQASDSGRDVTGLMHNNVVTKKWKIELDFLVPSEEEVSTLLNLIDTPTFMVTFYNPLTRADDTRAFYVGDRSLPIYSWEKKTSATTKITYNSMSFNIIEV